ncbi:MAG TPA: agmatinase [Ktedonobacterales bacterium]|jgi:agmatinase|nr:agmatinase [Ktedonobacterales bacterium]
MEQRADNAGTPPTRVVVVGVPLDENSSFLRGPALAPARIRAALGTGAMNLCTEDGDDLAARADWRDVGDLALASHGAAAFAAIERGIADFVAGGARVLSLGGDHSITYPILRAVAATQTGLTILHFDAHPDLYEVFEGSRRSHACPFARIMEEGLATRLVQVGIRASNPHQRAQAQRFGVETIAMRDFRPELELDLRGPLYCSLDLDALDPAFAPGVSHHEPGGLSVREVLRVLERIEAPLVGADIVEYNPIRDHAEVTAMVAAKFYKEMVGHLLR